MNNPIKQGLESGKLLVASVGPTIYVYSNSPDCIARVEKEIKRDLEVKGVSRHHRNGSKEFITYDAIHNVEDDSYIWDKSGDKVKHNKVRHIVAKDGAHTTEIIGTSYRTF